MIFTVPISKSSEMANIFKLLDENGDDEIRYDEFTDSYMTDDDPRLKMLRSFIHDCGVSHSTLEEVFMKVTGKK